jgi:murein DD-endopeptidase MepM/ murein hydrolase activator NlpD
MTARNLLEWQRVRRLIKKSQMKRKIKQLPSWNSRKQFVLYFLTYLSILMLVASCAPVSPDTNLQNMITPIVPTSLPAPTSGRPEYAPGELIDYTAQSGDTITALAKRFNTTEKEIMAANPIIPIDATTMPQGLPMKIPIYYLALWGPAFQSIPDNAFVNGPSQIGFSTPAFVASANGWLKNYSVYAGGEMRTGGEMVDYVAQNYSVSPRLLLALLEYQAGALSQPNQPSGEYALGLRRTFYDGIYLQLVLAANTLNNGYYAWRNGDLTELELLDKTITRPDPWQNAGSVALQYYFSRIFSGDKFYTSIGPDGLARVYRDLFGDPWADHVVTLPGSLQQPALRFPFLPGQVWAYTGGPHTGWGTGEPYAAIDFAPGSETSGCVTVPQDQYATAMADGLVVRSDIDGTVIDLDKDGDERTGWVLYYLHLATNARVPVGREVKAGDPVGYPSCEGGHVTGTHVHIARKYNGEWILADGPLAFNLEGWVAHDGSQAYLGTLTRGAATIIACDCSNATSQIVAQQQ